MSSPIGTGAPLRTSSPVDPGDVRGAANSIRATLLELSYRGGTPHIASALSTADILAAAYWRVVRIDPANPEDPARDRFIFSKGHAATALYAALAHRGILPWDVVATFNVDGSPLQEHPGPQCAPGVELATGSLGHGLPVAVGIAEAMRMQGRDARTYVLMSDGECNEGSVWEAAMLAPARGLTNLAVIVDFNKWQATDRSTNVMAIEPFAAKWAAFGWASCDVDGHDLEALVDAMSAVPGDRPTAIVAHTTKGSGVSFMEDDNNWHYRTLDEETLERALAELAA